MPVAATELTREVVNRLVGAAVMAPSSHNSQPWIFRVRGRCIGVIADRTRALPANDPDDRELTLSCGCALFNMRVAAAHAGLGTRVYGPTGQLEKAKKPPLARVVLGKLCRRVAA